MFTGIITGVGRIAAVHAISSLESASDSSNDSYGKRLLISTPHAYLDDVGLGDSIAINGACMTVTSFDADKNEFTIDISARPGRRAPERGIALPGRLRGSRRMRREYFVSARCSRWPDRGRWERSAL